MRSLYNLNLFSFLTTLIPVLYVSVCALSDISGSSGILNQAKIGGRIDQDFSSFFHNFILDDSSKLHHAIIFGIFHIEKRIK